MRIGLAVEKEKDEDIGMNKTKQLQQAFYQHLSSIGYPKDGIELCKRQRLSGDWDCTFEITNPDSAQLLAVVGQTNASTTIKSYALNLSYSDNDKNIMLSESQDAGVHGFLFSRGSGNKLTFYRIKYSDGNCVVTEINEFPSFEKLKRQYRLKALYQNVISYSAKIVYRDNKKDGLKYYEKPSKKRTAH